MGIVEIEMQVCIAMEQVPEFLKRNHVTEHAVHAIGKVPYTLIAWAQLAETFIEGLHVVVTKYFHEVPIARTCSTAIWTLL
jgi:hypothetical protein